MQNDKTKVSSELLGIDKALHRAAAAAKKQAELQGTPYVVYHESTIDKALINHTQSKKLHNANCGQ